MSTLHHFTRIFLNYFFKLVCVNIAGDSNCNNRKQGYNDEDTGCYIYKEWMEINCRKSCNLCAGKWYNFNVGDQ